MSAEDRLLDAGFEGVIYFTDFDYDDALIGVDINNRAVYDYSKMIDWLMNEEGFSDVEAMEWVDYNTIRALPYMGEGAPIIIYPLNW